MSQPNPFSRANAPEHNLVSKVVTVLGGAGVHYDVAVDLVDIDTAYISQIGSSGSSGSAYFNNLYVTQINGSSYPPSGGGTGGGGGVTGATGPTGPTGANAFIAGGTGISVSYSGQTGTITNTGVIGITGGSSISVTPVLGQYNQYQVNYTGGSGGSNIQGPSGQILFFGATGVSSASQVTYDGIQVNVPTLQVGGITGGGITAGTPGSSLFFESAGSTSTIYSGLPNSGNVLNFADNRGNIAMSINTNSQSVRLGTTVNSAYSLDILGGARITYLSSPGVTDALTVVGNENISGVLSAAGGANIGDQTIGGSTGAGGAAIIASSVANSPTIFNWSDGNNYVRGNTQITTLNVGNTFGATLSGEIRATGNVYATDFIATSDIRSKENIVTIDSALSKVLGMHGVYFTRKNEEGRRVGVIAQEVEEVLPEVVYVDGTGMKSVSYGSIVGLLIEAIKEQNEKFTDLKRKLDQ